MSSALVFNHVTGQWTDFAGNPVHVHFAERAVAARIEGRAAPASLLSSTVERAEGERRALERRRSFLRGRPFHRRRHGLGDK